MDQLTVDIQSKNVRIIDIEINNNNLSSNNLIGILLGLKISREICHGDLIQSISNKKEVIFLQEIN